MDDHLRLVGLANKAGVLCAMEVHKRWDPIYRDAHDRTRDLGGFGHFASYMSQPKSQLETFRAWAGRGSDNSYYLNAHHVDFSVWAMADRARPVSVTALDATGVAKAKGLPTEDTITSATQWENLEDQSIGSALYTASWTALASDVRSQQRFHFLNPLFMKYTPAPDGSFAEQGGYGYQSIAAFIKAAESVNAGATSSSDWDGSLATAFSTVAVTAVLEAGRRSLESGGGRIRIDYGLQAGVVVLSEE